MIRVSEVIVVEGRYDKNTISQVVDATIIETNGFGIFSDTEKLALLRQIAEKRGIILFTDSDGAGFVIRNHIKGAIDQKYIKNAYIPDVPGKERRKTAASKEGKLGVEGMTAEIILSALRRAGATMDDTPNAGPKGEITKADMLELGLSGAGSAEKRRLLSKKLCLPEKLSSNALLDVLNAVTTKPELVFLMKSKE